MLGLSAGTVITKETMEPNNRVLLKGFIVWLYCFVIRYRCLGTKENKTLNRILVIVVK